MAGQLTISTLKSDTGVLAAQNGMTGIAKAWVNFNPNSPAVVNASFNISSVTRTGTGAFTVSFTTAMADANYSAVFGGRGAVGQFAFFVENNDSIIRTTTQLAVYSLTSGATTDGNTKYSLAIFGA